MDAGIPQPVGLNPGASEVGWGGRWGDPLPLPRSGVGACVSFVFLHRVEKVRAAHTPGFPGFVQILQLKYLLGLGEA